VRSLQSDLGVPLLQIAFLTASIPPATFGQFKGGINEVHKRFHGELEVFEKNGVDVVAESR
jgi:hypothetical protein